MIDGAIDVMAHPARVAEVVWYATGRFYLDEQGKVFDVGYFLHIQGVKGPLFDGPKSARTARFTFSAEPFDAPSIDNGCLNIGIDDRGVFSLYLRDRGDGASFDHPTSFAAGFCIATFRRVAIVPTVKIAASSSETLLANVFSARLISSTPFEYEGATYDFADLAGFGITQWGTAATESLQPPPGYTTVVPFLGSAVRVG
jgi:hypothetical protein